MVLFIKKGWELTEKQETRLDYYCVDMLNVLDFYKNDAFLKSLYDYTVFPTDDVRNEIKLRILNGVLSENTRILPKELIYFIDDKLADVIKQFYLPVINHLVYYTLVEQFSSKYAKFLTYQFVKNSPISYLTINSYESPSESVMLALSRFPHLDVFIGNEIITQKEFKSRILNPPIDEIAIDYTPHSDNPGDRHVFSDEPDEDANDDNDWGT